MYKILRNILPLEFLLFSGALRFSESYPRSCMLIFLLTSYWVYKKGKHKNSINKPIIIFIIVWTFYNHLFINNDINSNFYLVNILYPLGAYFAISSFSLNEFKQYLLKYLTLISAISIVIHLSHVYLHLPSTLTNIGDKTYGLNGYFFNTDWGENRLASIYWEPGQYQIIILFTLCLFANELSDFNKIFENFKRFGIIIAALLLSTSTTGYIAFMVLILGIILFSPQNKKYKIIIPLSILTSVFAIYFIWNSDVVQDKLNQANEQNDKTSFAIRYMDNYALLKIIEDSPITGVGIETKTFSNLSYKYGNLTSSNGWLWTGATNGSVYLLIILLCIFRNLKKMNFKIPIIFIYLTILISQANEYGTFYPMLYIYIFQFSNNIKKSDEQN